MAAEEVDGPLRDDARSCRLNDELEAEYVVYPDRPDALWVMVVAELSNPDGDGCACPECAPHDWLDPDFQPACRLDKKGHR